VIEVVVVKSVEVALFVSGSVVAAILENHSEQHTGSLIAVTIIIIITKSTFYPWCHSPYRSRTSSLSRLREHTQTHKSR
jgi:hypothetical protein